MAWQAICGAVRQGLGLEVQDLGVGGLGLNGLGFRIIGFGLCHGSNSNG